MPAPLEIIAAPLEVYLAAASTARPDIDDAPSGSWTKLGANGACNYDEEGLKVTHEQNVELFRGLGCTGQLKAWRTEESVSYEVTLYDLRVEQYAKVLNDITMTTTAAGVGIPGKKEIDLLLGYDVAQFALLCRGSDSPYGDAFNVQYWSPRVVMTSSPEPVWKKGEPAGLALTFTALQDSTDGFGVFEAQTAAAS